MDTFSLAVGDINRGPDKIFLETVLNSVAVLLLDLPQFSHVLLVAIETSGLGNGFSCPALS